MAATFLAKRYSVVEAHLGDVGTLAVDDEVTEALAEVGLVVEAPAVSEHLMLERSVGRNGKGKVRGYVNCLTQPLIDNFTVMLLNTDRPQKGKIYSFSEF